MYGAQEPVTARVTVSMATAPAAAPVSRPVPMTNAACQPNTAMTWPRVAPARPSSRSARRRSKVITTRVLTRDTAVSVPITPRIRSLPKLFWLLAWAAWALATLRAARCQPGWPAVSAARLAGVPPLLSSWLDPGGGAVVAGRHGGRDQHVPGGERPGVHRAARGVVGGAVGQPDGERRAGVHVQLVRARFQPADRDLP